MSSPLAEAFLLVTLNNCYETPSKTISSRRDVGGFVAFQRRGFWEGTSKSRPAWLQDGSVVAVTFRNWKPIVFQSNQSGLLSLRIATSSLSGSFKSLSEV